MKFSTKTIRKLKEYNIRIVYLFGSRAQKNERITSDFDIGVVFRDISQLKNLPDIHAILYSHLTEEFQKIIKTHLNDFTKFSTYIKKILINPKKVRLP